MIDKIDVVDNVEALAKATETRAVSGRISDASMRAVVTVILVSLFAATNLGALALVIWDQTHKLDWQPVRDISELLLPTQGALIGSALGFYFADSRRHS